MQLLFSDKPIPNTLTHSIFLAGPSPRNINQPNWRIEAVKQLQAAGFTGQVFIPLIQHIHEGREKDPGFQFDYLNQIDWECQARAMADILVFWIPRSEELPGFTTNTEFGLDFKTTKIVYGRPKGALKCGYLDTLAKMQRMPVYETLPQVLNYATLCLSEPVPRAGVLRTVPAKVAKNFLFQTYFAQLTGCSAIDITTYVLDSEGNPAHLLVTFQLSNKPKKTVLFDFKANQVHTLTN